MKKGQSKRPAVIDAGDRKALTEFLSKGGQVLLPLLEVVLSDRKLKVMKPRLRRRGIGAGGEVDIPAYVRIREGGVADHVVRLMMRGVSTRNYEPALRRMADTAGVS